MCIRACVWVRVNNLLLSKAHTVCVCMNQNEDQNVQVRMWLQFSYNLSWIPGYTINSDHLLSNKMVVVAVAANVMVLSDSSKTTRYSNICICTAAVCVRSIWLYV